MGGGDESGDGHTNDDGYEHEYDVYGAGYLDHLIDAGQINMKM